MGQRYFLGVAGNIGVGKTHLTSYLGKRLGWEVFFEPVVENPYLDDFYADMRRWSFHLQVYFLSKRFEMHRKMMDNMLSCIQDRTIYEDAEIFARTLHETGAMDERDFENYMALFACMTSYLRAPNAIIYLRADVDTLVERIAKRGRDCEKSIDREYLQLLNLAYDDWAERSAPALRFLVVDTEGLERVEEHPAIVKLVEEIEAGGAVEMLSPASGPRQGPQPGAAS
ncbi:MAG: deoxynucleoside kinase [Candidatus Krumholzibacteriia bacterium]